MWMDLISAFLQKFMEMVLPVLVTALAGLFIAWITKIINDLKARLSDRQEWIIDEAVNSAILAAEQVRLKDALVDKKAYALNVAETWLESKGIHLDLDVLDAKIEAAVFAEFNAERKPVE